MLDASWGIGKTLRHAPFAFLARPKSKIKWLDARRPWVMDCVYSWKGYRFHTTHVHVFVITIRQAEQTNISSPIRQTINVHIRCCNIMYREHWTFEGKICSLPPLRNLTNLCQGPIVTGCRITSQRPTKISCNSPPASLPTTFQYHIISYGSHSVHLCWQVGWMMKLMRS